MKFESFAGKSVMVGGRILTFTSETYDTSDKEEIAALKGARKVNQVREKNSTPDKQSPKEDNPDKEDQPKG